MTSPAKISFFQVEILTSLEHSKSLFQRNEVFQPVGDSLLPPKQIYCYQKKEYSLSIYLMQLSWWIVPCPVDTVSLSRLCHLIINTAAVKFWKPTWYWTDLRTWRKHGWSGLEANCASCDEVPNVSASMQLASLNWNPGTLGVLELSVRGLERGSGTESSLCPWNVRVICILGKPNADEYIVPFCYASLRYFMFLRLLLGN